jgi:hypothetical protein
MGVGSGGKEEGTERTDMDDIFRPYAIFAMIGLSEKRLRTEKTVHMFGKCLREDEDAECGHLRVLGWARWG